MAKGPPNAHGLRRRVAGEAEIETERLILRRFALDDAAAFLPLVSLPDVLRYTGDRPLESVGEVAELLECRPLRDYELYGYGRMACIERATGRLIGFSGLKYLPDMEETDVGYRFLPEAWGKGYATESAAAVMEVQPAEFGLARVIGLVQPENLASVRVLRKLGMHFERHLAADDHPATDLYAISFASDG